MANTVSNVQSPSAAGAAASSYRGYLSKAEITQLKTPNNRKAVAMFALNWLIIAACFVAIAWFDAIAVTLAALLVMAGRQLGLGILLHECSHRGFFSSPSLNEHVGHWLAGMPLLVPMSFYRPYHMLHHNKTGTDLDPDVDNIRQYPVSKTSLLRKLLRDFSGLSGLKILFGVLFYVLPNRAGNSASMGAVKASHKGQQSSAWRNVCHAAAFHAVFFALFYFAGQPLLYAYWWLCFVFVYPFILRVRQIAEHAALPSLASADVRNTTRTTYARWWERALFAPNYVNYHCEHHYLPTVPSYNLKAVHNLLVARGFYQQHPRALVTAGYPAVLAVATAA